ncbi:hypothetical protein Pmar_PMAR029199, partial [Perkinsus marinus ATCC 50983]
MALSIMEKKPLFPKPLLLKPLLLKLLLLKPLLLKPLLLKPLLLKPLLLKLLLLKPLLLKPLLLKPLLLKPLLLKPLLLKPLLLKPLLLKLLLLKPLLLKPFLLKPLLLHKVLHGDIPIPEGWISSTNKNKPSIWINKQQYRFKKGLEDSKSRYECCSKKCYASFTVQERNGRLYFTRRPSEHGAECDREPDERRETQTRQRRRIQAEVANNGRTDGLVEGIIADGGLANTTLRDQRNLEQVAYRAARAQGQPAVLRSLDLDRAGYYQDFVSLVQRDVDKCRGNDQRLLLHADAGRPMIIWAADRNLNALNGSSGLIFDATFAVAPKGWQQLWVILIEKQGYYIPAVFILMARKTQEEYERALLKLRDVLTGKGLFQIISTLYIITDYELGMRQAILRVWEIDPERLRGCLFHLSKSWIRAYQSEGLASEYWASENVRTPTGRWLRSVIGLPCLSVEECKLAWADMKERKPQGEKIAKLVLYLDSHYMTDTSTFP